jgi:hypothetical protein
MAVSVDADVIMKNPVGDDLDDFRRVLKASCEDLGIRDWTKLQERAATLEASPGIISYLLGPR